MVRIVGADTLLLVPALAVALAIESARALHIATFFIVNILAYSVSRAVLPSDAGIMQST